MERARARRDEDGFTLVELVASLTVLAVGIVGVIGVTTSSFRLVGSSSGRSRAVAVATMEVEELRAVPYEVLAVTGGAVLTETHVVDGASYRVEKAVEWAADGAVARAYKKGVVSVSWTDGSGAHEVHQSTYVYPGGIGPVVPASTSTTAPAACLPATATALVATSPLDPLQAPSVVDLTWQYVDTACQAEAFIIQYSTNGFATSNEVTRTATANAFRVTGLSAGTTYGFRVAARSAASRQSAWTNVASVTTAVSTVPGCSLGSLTITPAAVNKKSASSGSGLDSDPTVQLPTTGTCGGFQAVYRPTPSTARTVTLLADTSRTYRATLEGRFVAWDVGQRYVDIHETATGVRVGSVLLTVCEHNVSRCA